MERTGLKVVLVPVGLLFTAGVYSLIGSLLHPVDSDTGDTMMLTSMFARSLPAYRSAESIGTSQPDRLRSVVKLHPCRGNVDTGTPNRQPAGRISGRVGCACCRRCNPDRAGSGEISCAGIGSHCIGSYSGRTLTPTFPFSSQDGARHAPMRSYGSR